MSRRKILIVDDVEINRMILSNLFEEEFDILEAENGRDGLSLVQQWGEGIAVVLLDLVMPEMDGFEVLQQLRERGFMGYIPVILITGEQDEELALTGYKMGISDLINKPFNPAIVYRRVHNVVGLYDHQRVLEERLLEQKQMLFMQSQRLRRNNQFVIDALSTAVEFRNFESGEHIKRIRVLTRRILENLAAEYGMTEDQIEGIANASAVHDIGKIAIPDSILLKPGPLTAEEFEVMRSHTTRGCAILESLEYMEDRQYYQYCYDICRHHHERWDGNGYPDGLKREEISIWAQAASLADVFDALTNERVYKAAYPPEMATQMILDGACGVFNPKMLNVFLQVKDSLLLPGPEDMPVGYISFSGE